MEIFYLDAASGKKWVIQHGCYIWEEWVKIWFLILYIMLARFFFLQKQEDKINKLEDELENAKARTAELSGAAILAASAEDIDELKRAKAELEAALMQCRDDLEKEMSQKQVYKYKVKQRKEKYKKASIRNLKLASILLGS